MTLQELLINLRIHVHPVDTITELQTYTADKVKAESLKRIGRAISNVDQAYVGLAAAIKETLDVEVSWLKDHDGSAKASKNAEATKAALLAAENPAPVTQSDN